VRHGKLLLGQRAGRSRHSSGYQAVRKLAYDPQLYVDGEFVGGSDILREMYENGELQKILAGKTAA
jgi:hypothetical protein